jgi:SecD/SecF fusion protein
MSNKGFIKVFSVLLALISLYYLSFTVVGWQYDKKANKYANGNLALKNQYLDSLSSEKVYLGYTLKQIRQKEIGLGLDLKGGMTVTLEVDAAQVLRALANTDDPILTKRCRKPLCKTAKVAQQTLFRYSNRITKKSRLTVNWQTSLA